MKDYCIFFLLHTSIRNIIMQQLKKRKLKVTCSVTFGINLYWKHLQITVPV